MYWLHSQQSNFVPIFLEGTVVVDDLFEAADSGDVLAHPHITHGYVSRGIQAVCVWQMSVETLDKTLQIQMGHRGVENKSCIWISSLFFFLKLF